jgi:hypothetical protein
MKKEILFTIIQLVAVIVGVVFLILSMTVESENRYLTVALVFINIGTFVSIYRLRKNNSCGSDKKNK